MVFIPKTKRRDLDNVKIDCPITLISFQLKLLKKVILWHLLSLGLRPFTQFNTGLIPPSMHSCQELKNLLPGGICSWNLP